MNAIFFSKKNIFALLSFLILSTTVFAQKAEEALKIVIELDHNDWVYNVGEKPKFKVTVLENGNIPTNVKLNYKIGPEKMPQFREDYIILSDSSFLVSGFTLNEPGFLRLEVSGVVNGKTIKKLATAAFSPDKIKPTIEMPLDFNKFWSKSIAKAKKIPLDSEVSLVEKYSTAEVNVYHVSFRNINNSRIYGMLSVPKEKGKYPAVLKLPGAGVRDYKGDVELARKGIIVLEIGIHGIPVNQDKKVYTALRTGDLKGYQTFNLEDKTNYYYHRVYLGCIKALDFLVSQENYDGKNLAVSGGSQGGALSIVTAALDARVKYLAAYYPALSDVTGYLFNRAGGWPHLFNETNLVQNNTPAKLETVKYYDVVNFARKLKIPGFYSWGFNDVTCPPTSMYAAYNVIPAPKELLIFKETGHSTVPDQRKVFTNWLVSKLKN